MVLLTDLEVLSAFISDAAEGKVTGENAETSDKVNNLIARLNDVPTEQSCLPIQECVTLLETAQRMWNGMALHPWSTELRHVRARLKYVVTHLYLLGNNYFAPAKVKAQYFVHHFVESEKCTVMCLKTAKSLSLNGETKLAGRMLSYAMAIIDLFDAPIYVAKLGALRMETCFAQLSVAWDAADKEGVICVATKLEKLVAQSLSYKEAFLQFVFSAAESTSCQNEGALRALLEISLRLQQHRSTDVSAKEQSFFGVTLLQMANVLLQSSDPAAALAYAEESARSLDALEPLIVQVRAHLMLQHTEVAGTLFAKVASNASLSFEEVLGLSTAFTDVNADILPYVLASCRQRMRLAMEAAAPTSASPDEYDSASQPVFQYASFLLHVKCNQTMRELVECLSEYPCEHDLYGRFFFLSLWSIGYEEGVEAETQTRALYLAVQYQRFVSTEEVEGLFTSLATLALKHFSAHRDAHALAHLLDLFRTTASGTMGFYALVIRCQLSLLLEAEEDAVALVRVLCSRFRESDAMPSTCGQLLHLLLAEEKKDLAATVAQLFVESHVSFDGNETLEVLHVCALAALARLEEKKPLALYVCTHAVPVLEVQAADTSVDMAWWCRYLWQVGDALAETETRTALQITVQSIHIFKNFARVQADRDLLLNRILHAMRSEFDLFLTQEALLPVNALPPLLSLASEVGNVSSSADPAAAVLMSTEAALRQSQTDAEHSHPTVEILRGLKVRVCDLEKIAAACLKSSVEINSSAWRDYAAGVQMLALEVCTEESLANKKDWQLFSRVMAMYYKSYHMVTSEEQKRELLSGCHNFAKRLTDCDSGNGNNSSGDNDGTSNSLLPFAQHYDAVRGEGEGRGTSAAAASQHVGQILEFFTVESWNAAVKKNAMHLPAEVEKWMRLALELSHFLSHENVTRHTIADFATSMPIMAD